MFSCDLEKLTPSSVQFPHKNGHKLTTSSRTNLALTPTALYEDHQVSKTDHGCLFGCLYTNSILSCQWFYSSEWILLWTTNLLLHGAQHMRFFPSLRRQVGKALLCSFLSLEHCPAAQVCISLTLLWSTHRFPNQGI